MTKPGPWDNAAGYPQALFEDIYKRTYRKTLAYVLRRTRNQADAHDVVADAYLVAWRRLDELLGMAEPQAWLYGVAYKTLTNHRRSLKRHEDLAARAVSQGPGEDRDTDPAWLVERRSDFEHVEKAMERLSERDQEILRLAAYEELNHAEIAVVLGIKAPLVRSILYRARRRLNRVLDEPPTRPMDESGHNTSLGGAPS